MLNIKDDTTLSLVQRYLISSNSSVLVAGSNFVVWRGKTQIGLGQ